MEKFEFPTAEEARKMTEQHVDQVLVNKLKVIKKKIEEAAALGHTIAYVTKLDLEYKEARQLEDFLEKRGFVAEYIRTEDLLGIQWNRRVPHEIF